MRPAAVRHDYLHVWVFHGDALDGAGLGVAQIRAEHETGGQGDDHAEFLTFRINGIKNRIVMVERAAQPSGVDAHAPETHRGDAFDFLYLSGKVRVDAREGDEAARIGAGEFVDFVIVHGTILVGLAAHDHGAFGFGLVHFLHEQFDGARFRRGDAFLADQENRLLGGIGGRRGLVVERCGQIGLVRGAYAEIDEHGGFSLVMTRAVRGDGGSASVYGCARCADNSLRTARSDPARAI